METLKQIREDLSEYNKNFGQKYDDINENIKEKIAYIIQNLEEVKNSIKYFFSKFFTNFCFLAKKT